MKKILAILVMAGLVFASFTPTFAIWYNRIPVQQLCVWAIHPNGTIIYKLRTVQCLVGDGTSCGVQQCLSPE